MSLEDEIRNFIIENFLFGVDSGLNDDSSFLKEGIIDSTGIMQLVSHIQERYLVPVEDDELTPENLDSIRKVAAFIHAKKQATQGAASVESAATAPG